MIRPRLATESIALLDPRTCCRCGKDFMGIRNQKICHACRKPHAAPPQPLPLRGRPLGPREKQVAALIAQGHANKEIAARLHLSEGTIKVYLFHIFRKLGVTNRVELAIWETRRVMAEGGKAA